MFYTPIYPLLYINISFTAFDTVIDIVYFRIRASTINGIDHFSRLSCFYAIIDSICRREREI